MVDLSRNERRALQRDNLKQPITLRRVPPVEWPEDRTGTMIELWRSRYFLVQVHQERDGIERLSVCRTRHDGAGWVDGMSWDELMEVKRQCHRGHRDALEIYPRDRDVVNVANFRHLWVMPALVPWAWRK